MPLKLRSAQQKITPDVQTGCISCCSGDGKFGGPIWWNTPLGDDESAPEENRATWAQPGAEAPEEPVAEPSRKRPAEEEELDPEVQNRLKALKGM